MENKLYTEGQVKEIVEKSRETGLTAEYLILTTHPIELPSDEEIEINGVNQWDEYKQSNYLSAFTDGAKWLREQILNQNNKQ